MSPRSPSQRNHQKYRITDLRCCLDLLVGFFEFFFSLSCGCRRRWKRRMDAGWQIELNRALDPPRGRLGLPLWTIHPNHHTCQYSACTQLSIPKFQKAVRPHFCARIPPCTEPSTLLLFGQLRRAQTLLTDTTQILVHKSIDPKSEHCFQLGMGQISVLA